MAKEIYIVQTTGISLPGYSREQIKVGVTVDLDPEVAKGFVKRGFLLDAKKAAPSDTLEALKKENEALKKENEALKKENEALKKENEALKSAKKLVNGQG